jgi:hypothetical protein
MDIRVAFSRLLWLVHTSTITSEYDLPTLLAVFLQATGINFNDSIAFAKNVLPVRVFDLLVGIVFGIREGIADENLDSGIRDLLVGRVYRRIWRSFRHGKCYTQRQVLILQ